MIRMMIEIRKNIRVQNYLNDSGTVFKSDAFMRLNFKIPNFGLNFGQILDIPLELFS